MPKREPTPPPADDEPKYLTVNYPYPLHANMEIPEERKTLARWIACVMDQKDFFALYHKPTAPNMVIIEVARDSKNMEKLLGAHKWSEILRDPTEEEKKFESRVFYCVFNKGRDVQKAGERFLPFELSTRPSCGQILFR
ncbi:hypothetical protein BD410DRAFT_721962 [Rickenella mellea]|uniref:Uncharacterized protein n=1 Tax=Rickenella mellea TaxID=50990 RepID=A0A4Y7Q5Q1_9AGAM|nr:hypothetical protein BD410DRAFT_721962 [Rickenella mellea]